MISILVNIQVNLISRYVHLDKLSEEDDNEDESDMVSFNYFCLFVLKVTKQLIVRMMIMKID